MARTSRPPSGRPRRLRSRCWQTVIESDRAGRSRRCQLDDPDGLARPDIDVLVEAELVDVERLGLVDGRDRNRHKFDCQSIACTFATGSPGHKAFRRLRKTPRGCDSETLVDERYRCRLRPAWRGM